MAKYPPEATERIPAKVFACLLPGEMRIHIRPGLGIAEGAYRDVPIDLIPAELRVPNASVWVQLDEEKCNVVRVWKREPDGGSEENQ